MKFDKIPKQGTFGHVSNEAAFREFEKAFHVIGVNWGIFSGTSNYFLRLLQSGSSQRERKPDWQGAWELEAYQWFLLDHGAFWKRDDGTCIWTAMPYSNKQTVLERFAKFKQEFSYPDSITLRFLDDKYRFRENGDFMFVLYDANVVDLNGLP